MFRFDKKIVMITGGASGIGLAAARMFAKQGAKVAVTDIRMDRAEKAVSDIVEKGGIAKCFLCDVNSPLSIEKAIEDIEESFGSVDIFVSNAGNNYGGTKEDYIEDIKDEEFDGIVRRNLYAPFIAARKIVPKMREKESGKIILISSTAGRHYSRAEIGRIPYASAKAGQLGLTRQLAVELAKYNIQVNCVAPGQIESTPEQEKLWQSNTEEQKQAMLAKIPAGRRGKNEEVAAAILFMASEEASYITGQCLNVNGGYFMS